jgi:hypothetical protein
VNWTVIIQVLGLKKGAPDYAKFHDLSAQGRDEIPADVERIVKENELLPAMLRTVEYEKVTKEQLRGIIENLKSGRYKKPAVKIAARILRCFRAGLSLRFDP